MFTQWWNLLDTASQVFYCIAVPATLVLLVQTVLIFLGFDEGGDGVGDADLSGAALADADLSGTDGLADLEAGDGIFGADSITDAHDVSGLDGLRVFTIRGIVAFFVVFGWVGVAMRSAGISLAITIPVALLCGFATMVGIAFLLRAVMKLRSDGTADNRNAIGTACKVHLTVPPARTGEGKVHVMLQGALVERSAVTDDAEPIPTGSEVVVVGVSGQTDLVVARK